MKHLLSRKTDELISKFYFAQKRKPLKDDWVSTFQNDIKELKIVENEEALKCMSKRKFKSMLKKCTKQAAMNYLSNIQKRHSKTRDINYNNNIKIQPYLKDMKLNTEEKQFMFKLRTSMTDVNIIFHLCIKTMLTVIYVTIKWNKRFNIFFVVLKL